MIQTEMQNDDLSAETNFSESKRLSIRRRTYIVEYSGRIFGGTFVGGHLESPRRAEVLGQARILAKTGVKLTDSYIRIVWRTETGESTESLPAVIHLEAKA